jgi:transposase
MNIFLPGDVSALQNLVLSLGEKMDEVVKNYERSEAENKLLRERIHQLQHQLYGRKSEKLALADDFEQGSLFDEIGEPESGESIEPESVEAITIPAHKRKKRGRQSLPADLPRIEVVHDISKDEKHCGCGSEMSRIGEEVSEQLEMIPARFWVVRHVRPKYACKNCEGVESREGERCVKIAPVPPQLLAKTISTPSLLSHILVSKFCDSLPFYRQEQQFQRLGFALSRARMCNWAIKVAEKCKRLVELLRHEILSGPLINMDETTFQVLCEPDRRVDSKSYMWVIRGGGPDKPVVVYCYDESRSGRVASGILGDYHGYVQTDGYSGYDFLDIREGITHVGCWTHVRRKFFDVLKVSGVKTGRKIKNFKGLGKAGEALQIIHDLYEIEREAREKQLSPELIYQERQRRSKPIIDKFGLWLKELAPTVNVKGLLGKAVNYTLGQWPRLLKYLDDGIIRMDNNLAENAIRPFVVGRKNWLFFDQPEGAEAGAILYSLIETARANDIEPYKYFLYLFDKLPLLLNEDDDEKLKTLLPQNLTPGVLDEHQKEYRERGVL